MLNRVRSGIGCPNPIQCYASILSLRSRRKPLRRRSAGLFWFSCREPSRAPPKVASVSDVVALMSGRRRSAGAALLIDLSLQLVNARPIMPPLSFVFLRVQPSEPLLPVGQEHFFSGREHF